MNTYLDYNAGAPLRPAAAEAMTAAIERLRSGGNPSSPHSNGRAARQYVDAARATVAELVAAEPDEVTFTSGASEAVNTVLTGEWDEVWCSDLEHDCVLGGIRCARQIIPATADGIVDVDALQRQLANVSGDGRRRLVAVMAANNETGVIQPIERVTELAQAADAAVLCDAAQIIGREKFSFRTLGIDYAVISAAKIGGPSGVGAIIVRSGVTIQPLIRGGGQEGNRRAGTENVIGIAGFQAAAAAVPADHWRAVRILRNHFEAVLAAELPGVQFFGRNAERLPNTSCFVVPGWTAENLVIALDLDGFSVGAGAACSSGKAKPGRALVAMGFGTELARAAVRVSFGPGVTEAVLEQLVAALGDIVTQRPRLAA